MLQKKDKKKEKKEKPADVTYDLPTPEGEKKGTIFYNVINVQKLLVD